MKVLRVPVETDIKVLHKVSQKVDLNDVKLTRNLCDILTGMFDKLNGKAQGISYTVWDALLCCTIEIH